MKELKNIYIIICLLIYFIGFGQNSNVIEYEKSFNINNTPNFVKTEDVIKKNSIGEVLKVIKKTGNENSSLVIYEFYPDGSLFKIERYISKSIGENRQVRTEMGQWTVYYKSGALSEVIKYSEGKKESQRTYFESGKLWTISYYNDGKIEGESIKYFENGEIEISYYYKLGILNGNYYINGKDGCVLESGSFIDGKKNGEFIERHSNCNLKLTETYKMGLLDGLTSEFYKNGNIKSKGLYVFGKKEGEFILYFENGIIKEKSKYRDGSLEGEIQKFDENGNPIK